MLEKIKQMSKLLPLYHGVYDQYWHFKLDERSSGNYILQPDTARIKEHELKNYAIYSELIYALNNDSLIYIEKNKVEKKQLFNIYENLGIMNLFLKNFAQAGNFLHKAVEVGLDIASTQLNQSDDHSNFFQSCIIAAIIAGQCFESVGNQSEHDDDRIINFERAKKIYDSVKNMSGEDFQGGIIHEYANVLIQEKMGNINDVSQRITNALNQLSSAKKSYGLN